MSTGDEPVGLRVAIVCVQVVRATGSSCTHVPDSGAGVGGLALAVALQADPSIVVTIYEAQSKVEEIGAGIGCFGKSVEVIRALGLEEDLAAIATCHPRAFEQEGWDFATRQFGASLSYSVMMDPGRMITAHMLISAGKGQTFHRTHFLQMFRKHVRPNTIHFGKRLASFVDDGKKVTLNFTDGSNATCDVLVGCDGIRSAVRRCLFETEALRLEKPELIEMIEPFWSGTLVYRALFPVSMLREIHGEAHPLEQGPTAVRLLCLLSTWTQNIIAYPVSQGKLINLVLYVTLDPSLRGTKWSQRMWVEDAPAEEVLNHFIGWEREVQSILACATNLKMTKWAVHEAKTLPFFVQGRVALTGDGAHAMQSHSGSGANQTIEDVYLLSQLLIHEKTNADNVAKVLKVYDIIRRPYSQAVAASSFEAGEMLQLLGTYSNPSREDLQAMGRRLETYDEWHKDGDLNQDIEHAMEALERELLSGSV
ncbi:FAD/NAD(P)-binding domain-containing protein [Exidia glandulosa HHB12029]|uniref:FAD/NAD(P)-binding domain-containing protein n=1 Tax=Exidia glandulosa HHB12029 TaxID=1314781 RepID=A0A165FCZ1_EXIGL|nr:FAD/NAD(P)-binding domain-containing protein [Exidia glandulosa HHB12029]